MESGEKLPWGYGVGRSPHIGGTGRRLVSLEHRGCGDECVDDAGVKSSRPRRRTFTSALRERGKPLQCFKQESEGISGAFRNKDTNSVEDELDRDKSAGGDI